MGLKTIPFREIEHQAENMYEAVVAMSGQAKEELNERIVSKAIKDHQESELDVFDELDEASIEDYEEKQKVTTVAVEKFLTGEVKWSKPYLNK
ncbi:MAG: hypothetical protein CMG63_02385 [Candidatus Marinimicrobia bacterium]|nr:hypothetical protein [Candidatus Neomarinimicrobiota bacterium]